MTWLIPLAITAISFAVAHHKVNPPGPHPFSFGAVDILGALAVLFFYGAAAVISLLAWIAWLSWMAFT